MALSIPAWLEIPPALALSKAQQFLLQAMVTTKSEDAKIYKSLTTVHDMLDDWVATLVDKNQYGVSIGRDLGACLPVVRETDVLCAMVEINKAQQNFICRQDKKEYEEMQGVMTMFSEMIAWHSTLKGKGKGKRDVSDTAVNDSERCTKYARHG